MRQLITTIISFLLSSFLFSEIAAQPYSNPFYTKIYKTFDGLPDSYILNVYQDSRNYLWIGAYRGLSLFDGKNFRNYGFSNGMPDLYTNCFREDRENRIWISTRKGMGYIKNNTYYPTAVNDSMQIEYVYSYAESTAGRMLALTSKGMYEWNNSIWVKRNLINRFADMPVRNIVHGSDADYIAYNNHLVKYFSNGTYSVVDSNFSVTPYYLIIKKYGEDIIVQSPGGLQKIKDDKMVSLFEKELSGLFIYNSLKDSKGRYWVATDEKGLFVSEPGNETKFSYQVPVPNNLVSNIYEDKEQNIWLADFQGLIKVRESFYTSLPPIAGPMQEINNFFHDSIYLMTYSYYSGFRTYDGKQFQRDKLFNDSYYKVLKKDNDTLLDFISVAPNSNIWAVTRGKKLVRIAETGTTIIQAKDSNGNAVRFYHVKYNPYSRKIIACSSTLYEVENNTAKKFVPANNIIITNPRYSFVCSNGNIITHTKGGEEFYVINKKGVVTNITKDMQYTIFIPDIDIYEGPDKSVWVVVPGLGMRRYNWENNDHLKLSLSITTQQGLPNDVVTSICFDKYDRLWASTLSGIVIIESTKLNTEGLLPMIVIDKKNYDLTININENFAILEKSGLGNIWLSTGTELARFYPEKFSTMERAPEMCLEKVRLNLQETNWQKYCDSLAGFFELPVNPVLPYNMNNFVFHFKAVSFSNEGEVLYSYRTKGGDNVWSPPFSNNTITSIRFSPGTYTIYIRAKKANSDWGEPVSFTFTIMQPWWNTWGFRITGVIVTSILLTIIFRKQVKRIKQNAAIQNQLRDLEMKALRAQMNPHFIYNALNSIQSLVIDKRNNEAQDYMVKFSRLLRQVLNHSEENVITLDKELTTLELYIELESLRLNYELQYSINVDENIVGEKEWVPPLILQPFVENALWHGLSEKQGEKILTVNITENDEWIHCEVADNGTGRRKKNAGDIIFRNKGPRGMEITKGRLAIFNQTDAKENIVITDLKDSNGNPAGTTVLIKIKRLA